MADGLSRLVWSAKLAVAVALSRGTGEPPCGAWDPTGGYDCDRVVAHYGPHASMYADGAVWPESEPDTKGGEG